MRMSAVELVTIGLILLSLVQRAVWPGSAMASWSLVGLGAALMLVALAINPMRMELAPAGLALLIVLVQTISAMRSGDIANHLSWPLFLAGLALAAVSGVLAWGLPAGSLARPEGPFKVGVATSELTRPAPSTGQPDRNLTIKAWYPAASAPDTGELDSLWREVHDLKELPGVVRGLLAYLKRVKTHSTIDALPAIDEAPYPLLIYNHSLLSIASENTFLMEGLASRGYVVLSIRHRDQAAEYAAIQEGIAENERARDRELHSLLQKAPSRQERARLSLELFRNSTGMRALVQRRAEDSVYVVNNLEGVFASIPGVTESIVSNETFGALGLSLGGAVATQLCVIDARCAGAANLDGGLYGIEGTSLPSPYLMIYSEDNAGGNDAFGDSRETGLTEYVLPGAKHLDLHDASVVFPILKWFGLLGPGSARERSQCVRETVTSFFNRVMSHEASAAETHCSDAFKSGPSKANRLTD